MRWKMAADWFATRPLEDGIHLVSEPVHVNSFLVEGDEAAALIDTGLGIGNIRRVADDLATRDVFALNTHYHFDHTGGNHLFAERLIHEDGAAAIQRPVDPDLFRRYGEFIHRLGEALPRFATLDREYFHFLTDETTPRALPADFDLASWAYRPTTATRTLRDGDRVELGRRDLTVIHTPGHTPDGICLLYEHSGALFGGDTINTGPIYAQLQDSDLPAFARSTRRSLIWPTREGRLRPALCALQRGPAVLDRSGLRLRAHSRRGDHPALGRGLCRDTGPRSKIRALLHFHRGRAGAQAEL